MSRAISSVLQLALKDGLCQALSTIAHFQALGDVHLV